MRFSPAAIALSLLFAVNSSVGLGQQAPYQPNALSTALIEKGYSEQEAGNLDSAMDYYESALAADPANRNAFIAMAQIARSQELPGKAIRLYREALEMYPNDVAALAGQGEALVQRGAVEKAKRNLAQIETICRGSCDEAGRLTAALEKGPPASVMSAEAVMPKPTVREENAETP